MAQSPYVTTYSRDNYGPIGGTTQYPGTGKSLVVSISPMTHSCQEHQPAPSAASTCT